ncbi:DUF192 domain-containing protein [Halomicroarcula sp. F13]|uniref:DUF192 domain-containing protein n=1 Tax=Haloarcula rubra TaxID=2487747 RepID=A0AAW4PN69_9EURY|nr:DUF192 domain-containing protein [Halomicroarcula rubra]MBX0321995.1 DUF192 domain-containing protein [Halomicroarcula rubra]
MRIVHDPDGHPQTLAHEVDRAESLLEQARGLMFRRSIPDDYALVFPFDDVGTRSIHMLFVPFPLDVLWLADDEVQAVETVSPWYGVGWARADTVLELPAGAADGVSEGDTVVVEG